MSPDHAPPGNGLLLFFRVDDFASRSVRSLRSNKALELTGRRLGGAGPLQPPAARIGKRHGEVARLVGASNPTVNRTRTCSWLVSRERLLT